ncbi:MAG TPA: hypothetical protein VFW28_11365 [Micropepsaceae bacterium]|nr:hypothetical protein [Micropepsaceae bacterium]
MFTRIGVVPLIVIVVLGILTIIPAVIALRRLGFSPWWAIIAPISPLNIIGLWVVALVKWPVEDPLRS